MSQLGAILMLTTAASAAPQPTAGDATQRLHALFDREWKWRLKESPEFATAIGVHDDDDKLSDASMESLAREIDDTKAFLSELAGIDRNALPGDEQVNYDIFETQLTERVASYGFGEQYLTINADSGFHSSFAQIWEAMPFQTVKGYENYLARLRAFPRYMEQNIALMREGLKRGMTVPKVTLVGVEDSIKSLAVGDPEKSSLWKPFSTIPSKFPGTERDRLQAAGRQAIRDSVVPAYAKFYDFMTKEYLPGCRETLAASALPNGEAYYKFLIRQYTTLDMTADADPPDRPRRGEVDPRRDGRGDQEGRLPGRLRGVPRSSCAPTRSFYRQDRRGAADACVVDRQADGRQAAVAVQDAAAPAVHRGAGAGLPGAEVHRRPLQRRAERLDRGRTVLGQHLRARDTRRSTTSRR